MRLLGSISAVVRAISLYCHGAVVNIASVFWSSSLHVSISSALRLLFSFSFGSVSTCSLEVLDSSDLYAPDMKGTKMLGKQEELWQRKKCPMLLYYQMLSSNATVAVFCYQIRLELCGNEKKQQRITARPIMPAFKV
jgi:hypothetical protein